MTTNSLYDTWYSRLKQMYTDWHKPQLGNMTALLVGIYLSQSVHLSHIANHIAGGARLVSLTRRISRYLDGTGLRVRETYEPIIRPVLRHLAQGLTVRLIIDSSKVGFQHQLLMVAVAYRKRAIPVAWTWVRGNRGHSSAHVQLALLIYVRSLLPAQAQVELTGDCEFGLIPLLETLSNWGWHYALRQRPTYQVRTETDTDWQCFANLVTQPGQCRWVPDALLTAKYQFVTHLLAYWAIGENEPWLMATNLPTCRQALTAYSHRMWIEELFGDLKGHGFDLETTHLNNILKLSRLTLAVVILFVWLLAYGSRVIKNGDRVWVDRADRRDLSLFQIGWRYAQRLLANGLPVLLSFAFVI
jgi:hypothetical protein